MKTSPNKKVYLVSKAFKIVKLYVGAMSLPGNNPFSSNNWLKWKDLVTQNVYLPNLHYARTFNVPVLYPFGTTRWFE